MIAWMWRAYRNDLAWTETAGPVEGRADVPPDHVIETHLRPRTG